jgi:putative peptide zinc metalloprotease protein
MTVADSQGLGRPGPTGWTVPGATGPFAVFPVPRLSAGLQIMGEYRGSGSKERKYLVRRDDGQVVQLSRLLHEIVCSIDGVRHTETIAHRVSGRCAREISAANVQFLVEEKLQPLGVTVPFGAPDDRVAGPRSDLLLVLKGHRVLLRERQVARVARSLAWLHLPPVVVLVLAAAVGLDTWLFGFHGAMGPVLDILRQPVLMLAVFALTVASLVFHEFGHASACRYGGAHPGCIGCGLFLIWPSLYTDVTDVYRLGRGGRLRTDLGGVYFNVVFMVALFGGYLLTGQSFFLGAVYLAHIEILEQLMPVIRLDGYYILGDLAGVPDLFGKVRPILRGMLPGRPVPAEVADLKRSARTIVTAWVVAMVPLVTAECVYILWNLPRLTETALRSLAHQLAGTGTAFAEGRIASGLVGGIGCLLLLCPLAGTVYLAFRIGGRLVRAAGRAARTSPRMRISVWAVALSAAVVLAGAWLGGTAPRSQPPQRPTAPLLQPHLPVTPLPDPTTRAPDPATTGPVTTGPAAPGPARTGGPARAGASSGPPLTAPSPSPTGTGSPSATHPTPSPGTTAPSSTPSRTPTAPSTTPTPTATPTTPSPTATASPTPTGTGTGTGSPSSS